MKFGLPSQEAIDKVFCGDKFLSCIREKCPPGKVVTPEDITSLARLVFEQGVMKGIEFCEEKIKEWEH